MEAIHNNNPEGLTKNELINKINYLDRQINRSQINNGTKKFCSNRIKRVAVLKTYL